MKRIAESTVRRLSIYLLFLEEFEANGPAVWIYSAVVWVVIVTLWFGRPLYRRLRGRSSGP